MDNEFADKKNDEPKSDAGKKINNVKIKLVLKILPLVLMLAGLIFSLQYFKPQKKHIETRPNYAKTYTLVNDTVSQSANIVINIPNGIDKNQAQNNITFMSEIKGSWVESASANQLIFKPEEKLTIGKYYSVALSSNDGVIGKDFLVAEDPAVAAVFPKSDSEADEKSDITIIFNRPMVPLTSLDVLEEKELPVEIYPQTPGRFKWIGARTLQFIPQLHLRASSNYTVKIKSDFTSVDGLNINDFEHKFTTRKLRYISFHEGKTVYNQPITIRFNQPVNLEKTVKEIFLKNDTTQEQVDFIYEYGKKKIFNNETKKYDEINDESAVLIFNKTDKYGRGKFWDFENNYYFRLEKAYPKDGDIILDQKKELWLQVTNVINALSATSEQTNFATPQFFDPKGKLLVEFYEDIDLRKSKIEAADLTNVSYGEKCKNENGNGEDFYYGDDLECEKETDRKKIYLKFDDSKIKFAQTIAINFNKIINLDGLQLNANPLVKEAKSFPKLEILKIVPGGSERKILENLVVCANSPLPPPAKEDIDSYLEASPDYEFKKWNKTVRVPDDYRGSYYVCSPGEFETYIYYGLMPESDYNIKLKVVDDFDQTAQTEINFTTGKMETYRLNFYHLQNEYNITTAQKTRHTYGVENMVYVNMHICQLSASDMLYYLNHKPSYNDAPSTINNCIKTVTDKIELPKRYWIKNYFQVDLKDYVGGPGHYLITFWNPDYQSWDKYIVYERTYTTITNLGVVEKKINIQNNKRYPENNISNEQVNKLENLYWVTGLTDLQPISGAMIDIFSKENSNNSDLIKQKTIYADNEGIAKTSSVDNLAGAVVYFGDDSAIITSGINRFDDYTSTAWTSNKSYIYTDRPIYRPGHEVNIKGLYRIGYDGAYEIFDDEKVEMKVFDSRNNEIFSQELEVNEFGTFNATLQLDTQAPLGQYRIETARGYGFFEVEEYVPAAFKVETKTDKEEYISGDTFNLDVDASYYFGAPVESGEVHYSIASQDYHFDRYAEGGYNFGDSWYYCYFDCSYGDKFILRNKAALNNQGKAKISHTLDFNKLFKDDEERASKIFVVYTTVKNTNGQSVTSQKSFIVHNGEFYLGIKTNKYFAGVDEKFNIKVKSVNTQGQNIELKNIDLSINKIKWAQHKRKEVDGGYYYRWEKKLEKVDEKNITTDSNGEWNGDFSLKEEGSFEIILQATDGRGNIVKNSHNIYIWGDGYADVRPSNDTSLEVLTDNTSLNVGEEGSIMIQSPYEKAKALISIERGKIFAYSIVDVNQSLYKHNFLVQEDYIPNVYASVVLLSPTPEVKYGKVYFDINNKEKKINIEVAPNKTNYLPGEEVVLDFTARDFNNQPLETEFSVAVADLSVLALKGNPKKNPVVFFYDGFPLTVATSSNVKNILYEVDVPTGTKGGGGAEPDDLAKKKRGVFKDTAFWQAVLRTDKDGKAQVKFTLPDNLTTWQVETVGITKDTKLGVDYREFIARKDLMTVPLKPRFVVPGDEFYIGAKIFNQTDLSQKLEVYFSSDSLALNDESKKDITLNGGETGTIYYKITAPSNVQYGAHQFTLSARNDNYNDTVEQSIKIRRNDTYETTATANYSNKELEKEYIYIPENVVKDKGELNINHSATLAVFLSDGLNYLLGYPYGCSEQVASKLDAIAVVKKGLNLENIGDKFELKEVEFDGVSYTVDELVPIGLARIYASQTYNDGFSYYPGDNYENPYLTNHIINVLLNLKDAGYDVNGNSIDRAVDYLNNRIQNDRNLREDKNFMILVGYTSSRYRKGELKKAMVEEIKKYINDDKFINEEISNTSLAYLAILLSQNENIFGKKAKNKIYDVLENRVEIDARGAFLPLGSNLFWQYYETPIKNSALLLKALTADKRDNQILDRVLRWILRSRNKDGAWGSTNNTLTAISAMTDYLIWKKENESNFTLDISLDKEQKDSFTYEPTTILDQNNIVVPISELPVSVLSPIDFKKTNHNNLSNNFYYDMSLKYYLPIDTVPPRDEGFTITRAFYNRDDVDFKKPVTRAKAGDVLRGHIEIIVPKWRNFVAVEDFIPAGVELVNFNLDTEDKSLGVEDEERRRESGDYADDWDWHLRDRQIRPDFQEMRDDRMFMFIEGLAPGTYEYDYYVRVLIPGKFHHLPAVVSEMYTPENFGRTRGNWFAAEE